MVKSISPVSFISLLHSLSLYELADVDGLMEWSESAEKKAYDLQRIRVEESKGSPEDAIEAVESVATLHTELAIIALWRCVELCRKRVVEHTLGVDEARKAFRQKDFQKMIEQIGIDETSLVASRSINELRCINNAIKHDGYVSRELARFRNWAELEDQELGNLGHLYSEFRVDAESYITDLVSKAHLWWEQNQSEAA
ncbi:MAG: hypothetical protein K9K38_11810 [Rhodoferax sp.]|nr:hypothetical protein [Rhodoferax sp.]